MAESVKVFVSEGEINSGSTITWRNTVTPTKAKTAAYNKGLPKYAKLTDVTIHWEWKTSIYINATSKCTINGTQVGNTSSTKTAWTNVTISGIQNYFKSGAKYPGESTGDIVWIFDGTLRTYYARNWYVQFTYTPPTFVVSATVQGQGSVSGTGTYNVGSIATLTATPATGYRFVKWSDGNTSATRTVTVTQDDISANVTNLSYTAVFEKLTYAITASAGAGGTVSGGGTFEHGATVTIKATPDIGYRFVKWAEDGNTNASRTVTVSGNATYTAVFEAIIYTIKYVDNSGTSIVSASFGQEISARAISDKNITITYNETSSRGKTEIYKSPVRGWKDSNSIVAKDGKTYTIDVFDAPFYANKYSDLYNVFRYNKYGLINHYIDYGLSEGRQCKPNSSEPCGVYLQDRTINSLSTTHGQQIVLEAVYEDRVLVTIGDISKSGYIFKGWQSPEHTELLQPGTQVYFTGSATLTAVWEAVDTPPEFTSASLTYAGAQVSQNNKVPAGESCILSVGVT